MSFHYSVLVRCPGGRNELQYVRGFFILGSGGGVLTFINEDNSQCDNYFSEKKKVQFSFSRVSFFLRNYMQKNLSQILYCSRPRLQIYGYLIEAATKQFPALFD